MGLLDRRPRAGQSLIEFVFVIALFCMMLIFAMQVCAISMAKSSLNVAAFMAARKLALSHNMESAEKAAAYYLLKKDGDEPNINGDGRIAIKGSVEIVADNEKPDFSDSFKMTVYMKYPLFANLPFFPSGRTNYSYDFRDTGQLPDKATNPTPCESIGHTAEDCWVRGRTPVALTWHWRIRFERKHYCFGDCKKVSSCDVNDHEWVEFDLPENTYPVWNDQRKEDGCKPYGNADCYDMDNFGWKHCTGGDDDWYRKDVCIYQHCAYVDGNKKYGTPNDPKYIYHCEIREGSFVPGEPGIIDMQTTVAMTAD